MISDVLPTRLLVGSLVFGLFSLFVAVKTWRENGPGSGFKGYTLGFRIRLWMMYGFGLFHTVLGVVGLLELY